ncbi:hypothetical protein L1987_51113 [Smallanthus sonchifolius]|uniref:Uncharacterized protein n=1 Tax=Smallanthus sonchifolius TaxID=185202 RepID=A0ACB9EPE1_9ASTR|nr:hypothetical protein L1987_51113 [Smallanthus sonchifolius]
MIGEQSSYVSSSSVGVQETSKPLTISVGISKDVSETSNKDEGPSNVADLSASKCDNDEESRNSTLVMGNPSKVVVEVPIPEIGGSKERKKEPL